jgi:NADH:ubiquinone oxidoreductase subunit 3 (subunit A)
MDPAAAFFFVVLALQAVFVAALVLLVGRRFPARLKLYRFVAPAALPFLLWAMASLAYLQSRHEAGLPPDMISYEPVVRFFLGYAILWLVGVLWATVLIRWTHRT